MAKNKFPSNEELKKMKKKLSKVDGSYVLPPDASALQKAKYEVCRHILIYMHRKGFSQRELARQIQIPETRISEVVHYRIWKFTLDRLIEYYEKINPKVSLKVA